MQNNSSARFDQTLTGNASSIEGLEEDIIPVMIKGFDTSGMKRNLSYQITSLPKNGILFEPESQHIIKAGEILNGTDSYPWSGLTVNYRGNKDFFTSPFMWVDPSSQSPKYESFEFSVMANMRNEDTIGISSPIQNNISVVNVNDPAIVTVPLALQSIFKFTALNWESNCGEADNGMDVKRSPKSSSSNNLCRTNNEIEGISIRDPDEGIDFVRVDVKSTFGFVSINQDDLLKAEFATCSERNSTVSAWNCKGSGTGDREMTFVTRPNHLNSLFSKMTYESLDEGFDNVTLTIYDGVGNNCLTSAEHMTRYKKYDIIGPYSIHKSNTSVTCYKVEKIIPVHIIKKGMTIERGWYLDEVPMQLWVAATTLISSFLIIFSFSLCTKIRRKTLKEAMSKMGIENRRKVKKKEKKTKESVADLKTLNDPDNKWDKVRRYSSHASIYEEEDINRIQESSIDLTGFSIERSNSEDNDDSFSAVEIEPENSIIYERRSDNENEFLKDYNDEEEHSNVSLQGYEWIQYFDSSSGDFYYQNIRTKEVTWTKPDDYLRSN